MTNKINNSENEMGFNEAPASWNTRYVDPNGFECQITLRGESGSELLERSASAIAYLLKNGCQPYVYNRYPNRANNKEGNPAPSDLNGNNGANGANGIASNPAWCPIHQCEMKRWDKDGRVWYSHKVNGEWCKGKSS